MNNALKKGFKGLLFIVLSIVSVSNVKAAPLTLEPNYTFSSTINVDKSELVQWEDYATGTSEYHLVYSAKANMPQNLANTLVEGMEYCRNSAGAAFASICDSILSANFTIAMNFDSAIDITSLTENDITFSSTFLELVPGSFNSSAGTILINAKMKTGLTFSTYTAGEWMEEMSLIIDPAKYAVVSDTDFDTVLAGNKKLEATGSVNGTVLINIPGFYNASTTINTEPNTKVVTGLKTNEYDVTYDLDGGSVEGVNPSKYNFKSAFALMNPTKEGYTFLGWTGTDLGVMTKDVSIAAGSKGNRAYTAVWSKNVVANPENPNTYWNNSIMPYILGVTIASFGLVSLFLKRKNLIKKSK